MILLGKSALLGQPQAEDFVILFCIIVVIVLLFRLLNTITIERKKANKKNLIDNYKLKLLAQALMHCEVFAH